MDKISFHPIGVIHSPHKKPVGTPIQPTAALGIQGHIEVIPEYIEGIKDLDEFSYIILLYHFNQVQKVSLTVTPFLDSKPHGVFATRAPTRPNPIGLSIVHLTGIDKNILYIEDVDILDGTPILDIKPYIDNFDVRSSEKQGWIKSKIVELPKKTDDGRFLS
jgi:tRNA-Thr(GGU) m(6)t(6)A37 methyltransferase TsaA